MSESVSGRWGVEPWQRLWEDMTDNQAVAFYGLLEAFAEQYGVLLTNNTPGVRDGQRVYHIGDFSRDVLRIVAAVMAGEKVEADE